jgi:hypothetical protein
VRVIALVGALLGAACLVAAPTSAAEPTRVVSGSRAKGQLFDINVTAAYFREVRRGIVGRERGDQTTGGKAIVVKDLVYEQTRSVLGLRADVGLVQDLSLFVSAPLVLADDRSLSFDRTDDECNSPTVSTPSCVNEANSSLLRDGVLPGTGGSSYGLDAPNNRRFERPSGTVFRGPTRKGFEHLGLGLQWAALNQARDATQPTWILRAETRFSVGQDLAFDPENPRANTGVGIGTTQFVFSSVFSRRFSRFDPYLGGYYHLPLGGGPFSRYPLGTHGFGGPQHRAGVEAGTEIVAWEDLRSRQRVSFELRGRMELRFFGLDRGPLWEPLSGSSKCATDQKACRPGLDLDLNGDGKLDPNPGITRSPGYGVLGGEAGLAIQLGRHGRLRGLAGIEREQDRFMTDGRSGADLIDAPGRRFRVEDGHAWHVFFEGGLLF